MPKDHKYLPQSTKDFLAKYRKVLEDYLTSFNSVVYNQPWNNPMQLRKRGAFSEASLHRPGAKDEYKAFLIALDCMADGKEPDRETLKKGFGIVSAFTGSSNSHQELIRQLRRGMKQKLDEESKNECRVFEDTHSSRESNKEALLMMEAMHRATEEDTRKAFKLQADLIQLLKQAGVETRALKQGGERSGNI